MTSGDINVILHRLRDLEHKLDEMLEEARKTNGRVTKLEMHEAEEKAEEKGREEAANAFTAFSRNPLLVGLLSALIAGLAAWAIAHGA